MVVIMDSILSYKRNPDEDFYTLLGCSEHSSEEQILTEYRARVLDCHPDKNPSDSEAVTRFTKLTRAKEILCNTESRAKYDNWRRSGIAVSYSDWCNMKGAVHTSMHWASPVPQPSLMAPYEGMDDKSNRMQINLDKPTASSAQPSIMVPCNDSDIPPIAGVMPIKTSPVSPRHQYQKAQVIDLTFSDRDKPLITGDKIDWIPESGRPLLQKFRNYEI